MTSSALRASLATFLILIAGCAARSDEELETGEGAVNVDKAKRDAAARSAQIWDEAEFDKLRYKDLAQGPDYPGAPKVGSEIVCRFVEPSRFSVLEAVKVTPALVWPRSARTPAS